MAKSAQKLFEEGMRLDPKERATLVRLLIDALDASRTKRPRTRGVSRSSAASQNWTQAWSRQFGGKSFEHGCTSAECRPRLRCSRSRFSRRTAPRDRDRCVKSPHGASLWRPRSTLRVPAVPLQFGVHPSRRGGRDCRRRSRSPPPRLLAIATLTRPLTSECSGRRCALPLIRNVTWTGLD